MILFVKPGTWAYRLRVVPQRDTPALQEQDHSGLRSAAFTRLKTLTAVRDGLKKK